MSKLEELIEQYCPDGVEYARLGDVLSVNRGKRLTKTQLSDDGKYFVYHGSKDTPLGKYSQFNVKGKTTIVVNTGGIGGVKFCDENFWCSDGSFWIGHSSLLNDKYVYYYLSPKESYFASQKRVGGVPTIDRSTVENVEIPIPPLPVQEEIVRILDTFTELQAELQAELQKRKQQYNYYLDNLLNFNDINRGGQAEVRWMKLSDTCLKICSGGTPSRKKAYYFKGGIPWLRTQEVDWNNIYDTEIKITAEAIKNSSARLIPENCVIIAMYGATAGKTGINKIPLTTNQACCNLQINPQIALYKYVYYWVCKNYEKIKSLGQGSQNNINAQIIKDYPIPIPSMAEQQRIVSILDRFDQLTNDLTSGLPAEIEKRRQQYEYYRDKLLTFKRKGA